MTMCPKLLEHFKFWRCSNIFGHIVISIYLIQRQAGMNKFLPVIMPAISYSRKPWESVVNIAQDAP